MAGELYDQLRQALRASEPVVLATVIVGPSSQLGTTMLVRPGATHADPAVGVAVWATPNSTGWSSATPWASWRSAGPGPGTTALGVRREAPSCPYSSSPSPLRPG